MPANAGRLWHDERMLQLARAIVGVVSDLLSLLALFMRSSRAIRAENLVLRRQLARYIERGIKPRRVDHATRVSLALFTRLFDWRAAVVNVRPATIVRWHRQGWRIFWRLKCRAGRPPIPAELRSLIRRDGRREPVMGRGTAVAEFVADPERWGCCSLLLMRARLDSGQQDVELGAAERLVTGGHRGGRRFCE
jgi:hypothetical protein